jgi:hypothetical protein
MIRSAGVSIGGGTINRNCHFKELLIEENFVFSLLPMPFTTAMIASEIPAAINPYSMAVAAVSSAKNLRSSFMGERLHSIG